MSLLAAPHTRDLVSHRRTRYSRSPTDGTERVYKLGSKYWSNGVDVKRLTAVRSLVKRKPSDNYNGVEEEEYNSGDYVRWQPSPTSAQLPGPTPRRQRAIHHALCPSGRSRKPFTRGYGGGGHIMSLAGCKCAVEGQRYIGAAPPHHGERRKGEIHYKLP